MELKSSAFENEGEMPQEYTCEGEEISPPLEISDIPDEAESLVLIMDDPDALEPAGKVWDHWIVFNIPTSVTNIPEGEEPEGVQGSTDFDKVGYGGPCPPDEKPHNYSFRLYALNRELDLDEGSTKEQIEEAMDGYVVEEAELIGVYQKSGESDGDDEDTDDTGDDTGDDENEMDDEEDYEDDTDEEDELGDEDMEEEELEYEEDDADED